MNLKEEYKNYKRRMTNFNSVHKFEDDVKVKLGREIELNKSKATNIISFEQFKEAQLRAE